jgi:Skp family chaperone for outer membrane proteins
VLKVKKSLMLAAFLAGLMIQAVHTAPVTAQGQPQTVGTSVAVIDIPEIYKNHVRFKQAMDNIKKNVAEFEGYVRAEQTKITNLRDRLKEFNVGSADYKQVEEQMARLSSDLQVKMTFKRKEFMEEEARAYYDAYKEIEYHVRDFAQRNRVGLVLRFSQSDMDPQKLETIRQGVNRAVVYQDRLNITDIITQKLNQGSAPPVTVGQPQIPRVGAGGRH